MSTKRKSLCVDEKVLLIRAIEKGEKKCHVGRRLGLSPSTVATIWKNKEKFLQAELEGNSWKKLRKPKFEHLDEAMLSWYNDQRQNNVPVSGPTLKAAAEKFAKQLGNTDFKASEGWLGKFKHRHNIIYGKTNAEVRDVDMDMNNYWISKVWPELEEKYSPNDIFHADETGLFFKATPDRTLQYKGEKCLAGNLSKERITILVAANMSGTEKRKLLVISESKNPQCCKNVDHLPVTYRSNKSAWMTPQLFEEEVRRWDAELKGRKILLLIDNCPAHLLLSNLQNIELVFFPPNTSSVFQAMNQIVFRSLKRRYRRHLLRKLIETDGKTSINMLQALNFISKAWEEVTAETIQHSFCHTGLWKSQLVKPEPFDSEDNVPLSDWIEQFNISDKFKEHLQTYESIDEELATTASFTDKNVLNTVSKSKENQKENDQEEYSEVSPTVEEALDAAKVIEQFLLSNEEDQDVSQDMDKIHKKIQYKNWHNKMRQANIKMCYVNT